MTGCSIAGTRPSVVTRQPYRFMSLRRRNPALGVFTHRRRMHVCSGKDFAVHGKEELVRQLRKLAGGHDITLSSCGRRSTTWQIPERIRIEEGMTAHARAVCERILVPRSPAGSIHCATMPAAHRIAIKAYVIGNLSRGCGVEGVTTWSRYQPAA